MKKQVYLLVFAVMALSISSCGIQKRQHTKGFYLPKRGPISVSSAKQKQSHPLEASEDRYNSILPKIVPSSTIKETSHAAHVATIETTPGTGQLDGDVPNPPPVKKKRLEIQRSGTVQHHTLDEGEGEKETKKPMPTGADVGIICLLLGLLCAIISYALLIWPLLFLAVGLLIISLTNASMARKELKAHPDNYSGRGLINFVYGVDLFILIVIPVLTAIFLLISINLQFTLF